MFLKIPVRGKKRKKKLWKEICVNKTESKLFGHIGYLLIVPLIQVKNQSGQMSYQTHISTSLSADMSKHTNTTNHYTLSLKGAVLVFWRGHNSQVSGCANVCVWMHVHSPRVCTSVCLCAWLKNWKLSAIFAVILESQEQEWVESSSTEWDEAAPSETAQSTSVRACVCAYVCAQDRLWESQSWWIHPDKKSQPETVNVTRETQKGGVCSAAGVSALVCCSVKIAALLTSCHSGLH